MLPFYETYPNFQTSPNDLTIIHNQRELAFPAHIHSYIEILYVFSGVQHLEIDNTPCQVQEGEALILFPELLHQYYKADAKWADELLITCEPRIFGGHFPDLHHCLPTHPVIPRDTIHPDAVYAFHHISKEADLTANLGWIYIILTHLLRSMELVEQTRPPVQDMTHKIMEYIAQNFTENLSLDSLAQTFHVSKYYISRIFSDRIKMSFRNYLGLMRAEYAAKLIRTTDDSLTVLSSRAGFDSQRTFNRIFHAVYGMSPRDYRHHIDQFKK